VSSARAKRIQESVNILDLLDGYGYEDIDATMDREQQYRCDLHGQDNKPSARVYPQSNSTYCFACGKARDVVGFVMDKEGLAFRDACRVLEERYGLPAWKEEASKQETIESAASKAQNEIESLSRSKRTFDQESRRLEHLLTNITTDREIPMNDVLALWEGYDRIVHGVKREDWQEEQAKEALGKLRERVLGR